jgi:hypothetical protein
MTLYSNGSDASIHAFNWYIDTSGNFNTRSGTMTGVSVSGIPNDTATDISLLDLTHNLVFSVTDKDTVAWASGTITMSNARTFSISSGNTGNMAARTYIYLDTGTSTTVLQTTTTVATAMGANKKLIAWAQNGTAQPVYTVYDGIGGIRLDSTGVSISTNDWTYTGAWSVTDADTIAWASGTLKTSDGTSYSITGANTGNMSAKTYIYFDLGTSATAFQTTTTATTAIGEGKILVAIAQNGTNEANFIVMNDKSHNIDAANIVTGSITANEIAATTITAGKLTISQLSAITADLGTITAGTVTGATLRTASSNPKFNITSTAFQGIETAGAVVFEVVINGADAGDVIMGDDATGSYAKWDNSAGTFEVFADNVPTRTVGTFGGDGSDGALAITSGTTNIDCAGAAHVVLNYTSISITGTGALTFSNPHASGTVIVLKSQGNVVLTSSAAPMISAAGMGAEGGAGGPTDDSAGTIGTPGSAWIGTTNPGTGALANSGGIGSGGAVPTLSYAVDTIVGKFLRYAAGAGGGGGGAGSFVSGSGAGGAGGRGGGVLLIECAGALNFTTAGGISVAGSTGSTGGTTAGLNNAGGGGGGGGGGGCCILLYNTLTSSSGTVTVSGGGGGGGGGGGSSSTGGDGGGGGANQSVGSSGDNNSGVTGGAGGAGGSGFSLVALNTDF